MWKVTVEDGVLKVSSPYYPGFPEAARDLGGRWDGVSRTWKFDVRDKESVISLLRRIFGDPSEATTSVRVTLEGPIPEAEYWAFGRCLARRPFRDSHVKLGDGVVIVAGAFPPRGGSAKHPALLPEGSRVTLEVRDVPQSLAASASGAPDAEEEKNPLADVPTERLLAELRRRGVIL